MALVANGKVSMAGTYSANGIAVAAANATLDELGEPGTVRAAATRSPTAAHGLGRPCCRMRGCRPIVVGVGPLMQVWFAEEADPQLSRCRARHADQEIFRAGGRACSSRGVLFHPGAYENLFVSAAHSAEDVDLTLDAARDTAQELSRGL